MKFSRCLIAALMPGMVSATFAYDHHDSPVNFEEYSATLGAAGDPPADPGRENKPYFLLFSAQWCYWCHEFAKQTLTRKEVAAYLNRRFINVFIDVDVHASAYAKYRATGLPYTVFLNPDRSVYYQYAGTLYGDAFLDVIKEVAAEAGAGKYALGMESSQVRYAPPASLDAPALQAMPDAFMRGVLDNFDAEEYGLGKGQKSIQPRTFLYMLENLPPPDRAQAARRIANTLERAVERIYDPVEGGFFRYAEKRNWQIPHYEKFSDFNAGAILLLYQLNQISPSPKLKQAADETLAYISSTLFEADPGVFLNFQIADNRYYFLSAEQRKNAVAPKVMDKIFTDRLAITLGYLLRVTNYTDTPELENKVRQSLDFLAEMIMGNAAMSRYYAVTDEQWRGRGELSDHAHVASLFTAAAAHFQDARYLAVAAKAVRLAISGFYNEEKKIFIDDGIDTGNAVEYLMELNGLLAHAMLALGNRLNPPRDDIVESAIAHYSLMTEVLEERIWDAVEWDFTEAYVPYLRASKKYLALRSELRSE